MRILSIIIFSYNLTCFSQSTYTIGGFASLDSCIFNLSSIKKARGLTGECSCFINDKLDVYTTNGFSYKVRIEENIEALSLEYADGFYSESLSKLLFYKNLKYLLIPSSILSSNKKFIDSIRLLNPQLVIDTNVKAKGKLWDEYVTTHNSFLGSRWYIETNSLMTFNLIRFCDTCKINWRDTIVPKLTKSVSLVVSGGDIGKFPDVFDSFNYLEYLGFLSADGSRIPESVGRIKSLRSLIIHGAMNINSLPSSVKGLVNLEEFNFAISRNPDIKLPDDFSTLKKLRYLTIAEMPLRKLPDDFYKLENLEEIELLHLDLKNLPDSLDKLTKLKSISISNIPLVKLSSNLFKSKSLESLYLSFTNLKVLPDNVNQLESLRHLEIWGSPLKSLPENIGQIKNLTNLSITLPRIKMLPDRIFEMPVYESIYLDIPRLAELKDSMLRPKFQKNSKGGFTISNANKLKKLPYWIGSLGVPITIQSSSLVDMSNVEVIDNTEFNLRLRSNYIKLIASLSDGNYSLYLELDDAFVETFDPNVFSKLTKLRKLHIYFHHLKTAEKKVKVFSITKKLKELLPSTQITVS